MHHVQITVHGTHRTSLMCKLLRRTEAFRQPVIRLMPSGPKPPRCRVRPSRGPGSGWFPPFHGLDPRFEGSARCVSLSSVRHVNSNKASVNVGSDAEGICRIADRQAGGLVMQRSVIDRIGLSFLFQLLRLTGPSWRCKRGFDREPKTDERRRRRTRTGRRSEGRLWMGTSRTSIRLL